MPNRFWLFGLLTAALLVNGPVLCYHLEMSPDSQQWTVLRLIQWTREYLKSASPGNSRLEAELLLAHALGCRRIDLYTSYDRQPDPEQLRRFKELVKRAAADEPIAYLTGVKEFYSLEFEVNPDVLIPRTETEQMVEISLDHLRLLGRPSRAWDVCTGSGCVGISIASQLPQLQLLATDISLPALKVAQRNAQRHDVHNRIRFRQADLLTIPPDCLDMVPLELISANPPYVADNEGLGPGVEHEPVIAVRGGADGLDFTRPIIQKSAEFLRPGGVLLLEFGYGKADAVCELVVSQSELERPTIFRDFQGIERMIRAVRR